MYQRLSTDFEVNNVVRDRLRRPFASSHNKRYQKFLSYLNQESLSQTCYLHWYLSEKREEVEYVYSLNPFDYIVHYENKYHLSSDNIWSLMKQIRWFDTNIVLMFHDKNLWPSIQQRFTNFRSLETNEKTPNYNTYITLKISTETFTPGWSDLHSVVRFPHERIKVPKRYRHLSEGIAYGYLKDDDIVSFAAAPHLLHNETHSFAIVRGIETRLLERKQGYSHKTLTKLCQEILIDRLIREIYLWVESSNDAAIQLYKKLGFMEDTTIYATYCDLKQK